jgi:hypothetical protein
VAKFPKETGRAVSTAKVTYHRRRTVYDNRWEAEFSAGGARAPYVVDVEAEQHILAQVLRDMGYNTGDFRRVEAPRTPAKSVDEHVAEQRARPDQPVQKQAAEQQDRQQSQRQANVVSRRERAGSYFVTAGERQYRVQQLRTDTPGYGVEHNWRVLAQEGTEQPTFDPFATKGEALKQLRLHIQQMDTEGGG